MGVRTSEAKVLSFVKSGRRDVSIKVPYRSILPTEQTLFSVYCVALFSEFIFIQHRTHRLSFENSVSQTMSHRIPVPGNINRSSALEGGCHSQIYLGKIALPLPEFHKAFC